MDKVLEEQLVKQYHYLVEYHQLKPPFEPRFAKKSNFSNQFKQEVTELVNKLNKEYEKTTEQAI